MNFTSLEVRRNVPLGKPYQLRRIVPLGKPYQLRRIVPVMRGVKNDE